MANSIITASTPAPPIKITPAKPPVNTLIQKLYTQHTLDDHEFERLLGALFAPEASSERELLFEAARDTAQKTYGKKIYLRGLIEFTNYCKNNCYYCGIRAGNKKALRYRLTKEDILERCSEGYALGFHTFVLQGGEDPAISSEEMTDIITDIRQSWPDCAITLSVGECSHDDYERWFLAGANRYLLRHETADDAHYRLLHPDNMSLSHRKQCLYDLKAIGFQTGAGFMVGSPGQTTALIMKDLRFLEQLRPHMIGIGPFIPHKDTPFAQEPAGTLIQTTVLLGILRLMHPKVLLPSTTALSTIAPDGRELGILAGANVVMPNLSPKAVRKKYMLYDNKRSDKEEAGENIEKLRMRFNAIGYDIDFGRGDFPSA